MKRLLVAASLLLVLSSPVNAGWEEGQAALEAGDYATAFRELLPVAERGHARAQRTLAVMYQAGLGVPKDDVEAAIWNLRAAEQGDAGAQYDLGVAYHLGQGVQKNQKEAVRWTHRAAEQGDAMAQHNLGVFYENGSGLLQDYVQAYLWYNLSALRLPVEAWRRESAELRDSLANRMTPEQIAVAQEMARNWRPKPEQPAKHGRIVSTEELFGKAPSEEPRASRSEVAEAQAALASLGYDPGPADGILGSKTRAAIRAYQAAVGLSVDGEVTDALLDSLKTALAHADANISQPEEKAPELSATGTGFVVSLAGHILTNLHVVNDCKFVRARRSGVLLEGTAVLATDSDNDLALLLPRTGTSGLATFRQGREVRAGDSVVAVGFPLQGLLASSVNVTTGTVSAVAGIQDDARYLQITAPIQPGNSGGPLFDMSGNIVGVVVAKLDALKVAEAIGDIPQNVNFAIKDAVARRFLEAKRVEYNTAPSDRELTAAEIGERATGFTVLVECWR